MIMLMLAFFTQLGRCIVPLGHIVTYSTSTPPPHACTALVHHSDPTPPPFQNPGSAPDSSTYELRWSWAHHNCNAKDIIKRFWLLTARCHQDDLRSRNREVEDLDEALKERQWELHQRAAQVCPSCVSWRPKGDGKPLVP